MDIHYLTLESLIKKCSFTLRSIRLSHSIYDTNAYTSIFFITKKPCDLARPTTSFARRSRTLDSMNLLLYPSLTKIPSFSRWLPMSSSSTLTHTWSFGLSLRWSKAPGILWALFLLLKEIWPLFILLSWVSSATGCF